MNKKNSATVFVIDGGGRGSVLVEAYSKSPQVKKIIAIPGNDLMKNNVSKKTVQIRKDLKTTSVKEIVELALSESKKARVLVDVAQDNAVEAGLTNALQDHGITVMGPTREAGEIEWSKDFSRNLCKKYGLSQPEFKTFTSIKDGNKFLSSHKDQQWFVKASGLAEGKGAVYAANNNEALQQIQQMKKFGKAGETYLLEEMLVGEELSVFAVTDGKRVVILGAAQDHKRALNHDQGKNTGGMGCVSPPQIFTSKLEAEIKKTIFDPVVQGLRKEGREYRGILYWGGMLVNKPQGMLKLYTIEFNARWGDPEAQVVLPGIKVDLYQLAIAVANGDISKIKITRDNLVRVGVVAASNGYPEDYSQVKGKQIFGLKSLRTQQGVSMYSAGITQKDGLQYVSGGRLLIVVGEGKTVQQAREKAYSAISNIYIEGNNLHYRTDIGYRDLERSYDR